MGRLYDEREAEIIGRRKICAREGHELVSAFDRGTRGGVQMDYERKPGHPVAACDAISCERCDAVFTVTYSEIGKKIDLSSVTITEVDR